MDCLMAVSASIHLGSRLFSVVCGSAGRVVCLWVRVCAGCYHGEGGE